MVLEDLFKRKVKGETDEADKIFVRTVGLSIFAILACIVMLSASTYAWFTTSIETSETITSSVYKLDISLSPDVETAEDGESFTLVGDTTYTVTVAVAEGMTGKTGYIKLQVGDTTYVSQQIDRDKDDLVFNLKFSADTTVKIIECWGTSSVPEENRDILNGGSYGDTNTNENTENNS